MDALSAIAALDDLIKRARPVPLTDQVRVSPAPLRSLIDGIRAAIPEELRLGDAEGVKTLGLVERLEQLARDAPPIPLTGQVRVDRESVYDLIDHLRAVLPIEAQQVRWKEAGEAGRRAGDLPYDASLLAGELDDLLRASKPTRLRTQLQVDRMELIGLVDHLRSTLVSASEAGVIAGTGGSAAEALEAIDELARLIGEAPMGEGATAARVGRVRALALADRIQATISKSLYGEG